MHCFEHTIILLLVLPFMALSFTALRNTVTRQQFLVFGKRLSRGIVSEPFASKSEIGVLVGGKNENIIPGIDIEAKIAQSLLSYFGDVDSIYGKLHVPSIASSPVELLQPTSQSRVNSHIKSLMTKTQYDESLDELKKAIGTSRTAPKTILNKLYLGSYANIRLFSQLLEKRKQEDRLYLTGKIRSFSTTSSSGSNSGDVEGSEKHTVPRSELSNVLFMYTDGCCIGNNNAKVCPAGWGVTVTKPNVDLLSSSDSGTTVTGEDVDVVALENDVTHCTLVEELYGPVVLDENSPYYLGATVGSNNTAELIAIGEALLWLLNYVRKLHQQSKPSKRKLKQLRVFIRYDSEYAAKSIQGIFNGSKNVELIHKIRSIYRETKSLVKSVTFLHVKGHSGHLYNDRADELANQGASMTSGTGGRHSNDSTM